MPDLVTHLALAGVVSFAFLRRTGFRLLFYAGTLLPDVATRTVYILLESVTPDAHRIVTPVHTPIGFALLAAIAAQFFGERRLAFFALLTGGGIHFLLDGFQRHVADGYYWLFPFSWTTSRWGLVWPETTIGWLPVTVAVVVLVEIVAARSRAGMLRGSPGEQE